MSPQSISNETLVADATEFLERAGQLPGSMANNSLPCLSEYAGDHNFSTLDTPDI
jgi:hypothetical protein